MNSIEIGGVTIGPGQPPYVIAEMSGNHNRSLDRAIAIVEAAAAAGVQAVKLQTYTADTMTLDLQDPDFYIDDPDSLWSGRSLHDLYQEAHTPWEWHEPIMERCHALGLACFSTPFDASAVDFLEGLGAPAYKIASFENIDLPLIRKVAATGKPLIVSTGMASVAELDDAVRTARAGGATGIVLLKCTSTYPASPENSNLLTIPHLRQLFDAEVGLSDHTLGLGVAVAAVALGASVVEKHFTLSRADGGVDSAFSLEPHEMAALVLESRRAQQALGEISYGPTEAEQPSLKARRSLYLARDVRAGEALSSEDVRAVRPGHGLSPKYLDVVLGMRLRRDAKIGTPLTWDLVG